MNPAALVLAMIVLLEPSLASAADTLSPRVTGVSKHRTVTSTNGTRPNVRTRIHRVVRIHNRRRTLITRTIGMPCVLPPHIQVAYNWPGPQCRYLDNFVLPKDVRAYQLVRRFL
jgi:hypothetical protein